MHATTDAARMDELTERARSRVAGLLARDPSVLREALSQLTFAVEQFSDGRTVASRFLGAWSMPVKGAAGRVLGTFGTYFREARRPTEAEMRLVAELAPLAAQAIERCGAAR